MTYEKQSYDLEHEASYAGARNLVRLNAKKEKKNIYACLSNQDATRSITRCEGDFPDYATP